jgi:nitroimidazol reductase NimA-like FMN-containing flavoprotein (pyridoxamine 5'-phosphate oxidase superfamily)
MQHQVFVDDLTEDVCMTLLRSHHVGRLAFVGDDGFPVVIPVNYVVDGDDIVLRTDRGAIYEQAPLHRVAFEVDAFDEAERTGWSILARGSARTIDDRPGEADHRDTPETWAPGDRPHVIGIAIERISGRQIVRTTSHDE